MDIREIVANLKNHYHTNDPFEIARAKNILILYEDLGCIRGYYNQVLRQKQIHINNVLSHHEKRYTCSHELGHAIMHPKSNTPFLRANTYLSVDKLEIQANKFAVEFLISDDEIIDCVERGYSVDMMSRLFNYKKELIELRLK